MLQTLQLYLGGQSLFSGVAFQLLPRSTGAESLTGIGDDLPGTSEEL